MRYNNFIKRTYLNILIGSSIFVWLILLILNSKENINTIWDNTSNRNKNEKKDTIECYHLKNESMIDISSITPRKEKSIFFHETSCKSSDRGKLTISSRQACAVESAARLNPNLDVYLLFSSPGVVKSEGDESDQFLKALLSYKNIRIMHLDYEKYTKGTPVEQLYTSGKIENSNYVISHASDVLRFLTLWKYGGIYLDLDIIVKKSFEDLPLNFAGAETDIDVGSAVLSFDAKSEGHKMAESCLNDLRNSFDGTLWSYNGPDVVQRLLDLICEENNIKNISEKVCNGFTVYHSSTFFPVHYSMWKQYFEENNFNETLNLTKESYTLHFWNKLSENEKISVSSNVPYLFFAKKYCPRVVSICKTYF